MYFYLQMTGGATIDDLGRTLAMKKVSLLSVLQSLIDAELVEKRADRYVVAN